MSTDSVSKTKTQPITPPPPQSNEPSLESLDKVVSQITPSLRSGMDHPSPVHNQTLGLNVGQSGFTAANPVLNPLVTFDSLCLGLSQLDEVTIEKSMIEGSNEKRKAKDTFQLPKENEELGFGLANDNDKAKIIESGDTKVELFVEEDDETRLLKSMSNKEEVKTWSIRRPRNTKRIPRKNLKGDGQSSSVDHASTLPNKILTRRRTSTTPRPKRPLFSLTLMKEEIKEDFVKMTGESPPKKPMRRPRSVQKHMNDIFPGMFLKNVKSETYKVSDRPLKR